MITVEVCVCVSCFNLYSHQLRSGQSAYIRFDLESNATNDAPHKIGLNHLRDGTHMD